MGRTDDGARAVEPLGVEPTLPSVTPGPIDPLMEATRGPRTSPPPSEPGLPRSIGRFEILRKLGEGGMGAVYLATDPTLGRRVAIKVLHKDGAGDADLGRRRLLREAQGTAQLSHEHVVVIHEVGTHDDQVYLAMEYVAGTTLKAWQADRGWREILAMYRRAGQGLQAAHDAGLVHRDFKPDNVLVGDDGRVRVTDFGLVAAVDHAALDLSHETAILRSDLDLAVSMTRTGTVMGTPRYMAPEQHLGEPVDARADQFAFGVALYEAWYRQPPFVGSSYDVMVAHVLAGEVLAAPATSEVPTALHGAVLRGLRRQRDDRFSSMTELLAALIEVTEVVAPSPPPRRGGLWLAAVASLVLVGGLAVWRLSGHPSAERAATVDREPVATTPPASPPPPPTAPAIRAAQLPATVTLNIDGVPAGTQVYAGDEMLGTTPHEIPVPRGDVTVELRLVHDGYAPLTRRFTPNADRRLTLTLTKKRAKPRSEFDGVEFGD